MNISSTIPQAQHVDHTFRGVSSGGLLVEYGQEFIAGIDRVHQPESGQPAP